MKYLVFWLTMACSMGVAAEKGKILPGEASKKVRKKHPVYAKVIDDPALPRVLIIGDSISIGYTAPAREALAGKANVHRIPANAGHTGMGLEKLPKWLSEENGKWDVIHFNWGLWDLCYRNPESKTQGNRDKVDGTLTHTPSQYAENLDKIVTLLKATGAKLVFATTTPIPEGEAGRKMGDDSIYNGVALEVMARHGVTVNDLHAVMAEGMQAYGKAPRDVHFTEEGYVLLGQAVADFLERFLASEEPN